MNGRMAVLPGYGEPIEIREYEVPEPEPGGMILRIEQAAICGSDLHVWRGDTSSEPEPAAALGFGHEGFGRVYKLGPGTATDDAGRPLRVGDRVIHHVLPSPLGRVPATSSRRAYGEWPYFFSTFADYFYVAANRAVFRAPDELPDDILPSVNCAMGAAINALIRGGVAFGSKVVIFGAGGLGLTATAAAKCMGATTVVVTDRIDSRLQLARQFGADHVLNVAEVSTAEDRVAAVRDMTGGADVVVEMVGLASLLPEGIAMLAPGGTFVEVGLFFTGTSVSFDPSTLLRANKKIVGSPGYPPALIPRILDFLVRNHRTVPFDRIISHRFGLEQINAALAHADWNQSQPTVTRAVLVPGRAGDRSP
jgi:threonine dehydrogenase-like Zn-dependent dehydrogenase